MTVTDKDGLVQPSGTVTLASNGSYSFIIQLQASQNGNDKDGRQYTITVSAQDNAGNTGSAATGVTVPHDLSITHNFCELVEAAHGAGSG